MRAYAQFGSNSSSVPPRLASFALNWKNPVRLAGDFHRVAQADFGQEASRTQQHLGLIAALLIVLTGRRAFLICAADDRECQGSAMPMSRGPTLRGRCGSEGLGTAAV